MKECAIKKNMSIKLDIGCGANKQKGFVGMDTRMVDGVDILHDLEKFPYPLKAECCSTIMGSHIIEHIKPWFSIPLMNELWRIMKPGGQLMLSTPYPGSQGYWQDPTHCNGWNEATFQYFDPRFPLYNIYKPKPWKMENGFPCWQANGNLEILLEKVIEGQVIETREVEGMKVDTVLEKVSEDANV